MLSIYTGCLIGGLIFAFITVIFGDILGDLFGGIFDALSPGHLDFLNPIVLVGGITAFGGAGLMLSHYTHMAARQGAVLAILIALLLSIAVFFIYVKPMKNAENSTSYSMHDLVGKIGLVTVPIPVSGYGEILLRVGAGNTNHTAVSVDAEALEAQTRVIVADVKSGILYVFPFHEELKEDL